MKNLKIILFDYLLAIYLLFFEIVNVIYKGSVTTNG